MGNSHLQEGIHVLTMKGTNCPSCKKVVETLNKLGVKFQEHDVVSERIYVRSIPQTLKDGETVFVGCPSVLDIKQKLGIREHIPEQEMEFSI
jgi:glutaredoxin